MANAEKTMVTNKASETVERTITEGILSDLERALRHGEKSEATISKYLGDVRQFAEWLGPEPLEREAVAAWKERLIGSGCTAATVNVKLSAINALLRFLDREDCRVRIVRVQRSIFRDAERDLSRDEYIRLVRAAYQCGNERLALAMATLCSCGLRVSELRAVTVEAVACGQATVRCKGKTRVVLLPEQLCEELRDYAARAGVSSGPVFVTRSGRPLSRRQIWGEMKALCGVAQVDSRKVFPHNLRHLFAVEYHRECLDIVKLADVMGHSSVDTTRIYLATSGTEHRRHLNALDLVPRRMDGAHETRQPQGLAPGWQPADRIAWRV